MTTPISPASIPPSDAEPPPNRRLGIFSTDFCIVTPTDGVCGWISWRGNLNKLTGF
jgi:hypothetical protein